MGGVQTRASVTVINSSGTVTNGSLYGGSLTLGPANPLPSTPGQGTTTFIVPGAPLAGYAGLPFVIAAALQMFNVPVPPVGMAPPPLLTLNPGALAGSVLTPGGSSSAGMGGITAFSGLFLRSGTLTNPAVLTGTAGGMLRAAATFGGGNTLTIPSHAGNLSNSGLTLASDSSGVSATGTTTTEASVITRASLPSLTHADAGIVTVTTRSLSAITGICSVNQGTLQLEGSGSISLSFSGTISADDPGTAFTDTNTVASITDSDAGALFPSGTNIHLVGDDPHSTLTGTAPFGTLVNHSGQDMTIKPSTTHPGCLQISTLPAPSGGNDIPTP